MSLLAPVHGTPYVGGPLPAICGVSESGLQSNWKVNYNAVAAPAVTDDSSKGYSVGSRWYYGTNIYECVSAGVGAAVWSQINAVTLPAGTGTELQYRNGSAFGAVAGSSWDGTKLQITGNIESTNIHTRTLGSTFLGKNQTGQSLNYVTLIGDGCYAANSASVGVGYATYVAAQSTAIGSQARAEGYASIAIGRSATSNVALTCVFGCGDYPINVIHAGKGITHATPTAWTLKGTGGSGTNVVGGTLYIAPGPSTGNATPSAVVIQSTVPGSSRGAIHRRRNQREHVADVGESGDVRERAGECRKRISASVFGGRQNFACDNSCKHWKQLSIVSRSIQSWDLYFRHRCQGNAHHRNGFDGTWNAVRNSWKHLRL